MALSSRKRVLVGVTLLGVAVACFAVATALLFFPLNRERIAEAQSAKVGLSVREDFDKDFWTFFGLIAAGLITGIVGVSIWKPEE
jgi:hypothetical protein